MKRKKRNRTRMEMEELNEKLNIFHLNHPTTILDFNRLFKDFSDLKEVNVFDYVIENPSQDVSRN